MTRSQSAPQGLLPNVGGTARIVWHSDLEGPIQSAGDFAKAMNCDVVRIAKTILLVAETLTWQGRRLVEKPCACVVLSNPARIDLVRVSQYLEADGLRLATISEIQSILGVKPGAVSPIVPGNLPVLVDGALLEHETVFVSGGQQGLDIEICPRKLLDLVTGCSGQFAIGSA